MRRAEAWASGEQWAALAPPTQAPGVFVGDPLEPDPEADPEADPEPDPEPDPEDDLGAAIDGATPAAVGADIDGEPRTEYHALDDEG